MFNPGCCVPVRPDANSTQDIIDVNQDPLGIAAGIFQPPNAPGPVRGEIYPYWAGPLSDGVVIGLVSANRAGTLSVNFADVPGLEGGSYSWKELYTGEEGTSESISFNVAENDIAIVKVTTS